MENNEISNEQVTDRDRIVVRTSIIGILANLLLAGFKAAVGIVSNSIAVTLDAVNNLSDALSSIVTIIGIKLAGKRPDKRHPLGHGRIEYLSAMVVSGIVVYAGIKAAIESVRKIIHPVKADYSMLSLIIITVAIVVKLLLGSYVKSQGKLVNSGSLIASGEDARFDAILSSSVLASAVIYKLSGLSLEAYVGAAISAIIINSGIEMMLNTLDQILGVRADGEITVKIKQILNEEPLVRGAYDLFLHNYGPGKNYGSVHLELPDTMTVQELDRLTRKMEARVYKETGVILTAVGVYAYNTGDNEAARIQNRVREIVRAHDWALQMHGFYLDIEHKMMRFDVVMSFDKDRKEGLKVLSEELEKEFGDYEIFVVPDVDITD